MKELLYLPRKNCPPITSVQTSDSWSGVPVLSTHKTEAEPSVSTTGTRRVRTWRLDIRHAPNAMNIVSAAGYKEQENGFLYHFPCDGDKASRLRRWQLVRPISPTRSAASFADNPDRFFMGKSSAAEMAENLSSPTLAETTGDNDARSTADAKTSRRLERAPDSGGIALCASYASLRRHRRDPFCSPGRPAGRLLLSAFWSLLALAPG
jgi:hypothetical protein